jgi:hypothetical protein
MPKRKPCIMYTLLKGRASSSHVPSRIRLELSTLSDVSLSFLNQVPFRLLCRMIIWIAMGRQRSLGRYAALQPPFSVADLT